MSLSLNIQFSPTLSDGTDLSLPDYAVDIPIGPKGLTFNFSCPTSDTVIGISGDYGIGDVAEIGCVNFHNRAEAINVSTPSAPVVDPQGTPGAETWGYKIVALQLDGTYSAASAEGTTSTGATTLNSTDFNRLTWDVVTGAVSYNIYRTTVPGGGTPSTDGLIGNTTDITFDDTGLAGDSSTAPATAADNLLLIGEASGTYPLRQKGTEMFPFRWNGADFASIHVKANTRIIPVELSILDT